MEDDTTKAAGNTTNAKSPYDFISQVKENLADDRTTLIKFTNVMKAFHNKQIEIEDLVVQVTEILKGHIDILNDFNEFLPSENKIQIGSTEANVAIITPQPSKHSKKVKVVAPSSPRSKRSKTTSKSKKYQPVMFSPPTPVNTGLPGLHDVFGRMERTVGEGYPVTPELEDSLKVFISKLIAKHTSTSAKYKRFLRILELCHDNPKDLVLEIIQLFAPEDMDLLHAFANLLSDVNKQDLLTAIQEYQLSSLTFQTPHTSPKGRENKLSGGGGPLTPTGMMHMAHHTAAAAAALVTANTTTATSAAVKGTPPSSASNSSSEVPLVTPTAINSSSFVTPLPSKDRQSPVLADSKSSTTYSLPSIHTVAAPAVPSPHDPPSFTSSQAAALNTFDTLFTCSPQEDQRPQSLPPQQQPRQQYTSQEEWQADLRRLKAYQYVFKVRAALRDEPDTYRKFLKLLSDYKQNINLHTLTSDLKEAFGPTHSDLIAGFLQLLG